MSHCAISASKFHKVSYLCLHSSSSIHVQPILTPYLTSFSNACLQSRQENGWNPLFALRTVRLVKSRQQYSWPLANKNSLIYVGALIWQSCKISQIKLPTWLVTHHLVSGWGRGAVLSVILQSMSFPRLIWVLTFWEKCMSLMSLSPTANLFHSRQLDRSQYQLVFLLFSIRNAV